MYFICVYLLEYIAKIYHITCFAVRNYHFLNFSKNYHKSGWLFQKTQVAERLSFNWGYDMWGPPVRVLSATVLTARG